MSLLTSCGEAFRRRYIEHERTPPNARMIRGRAIHQTAQTAYTRTMNGEHLPTKIEAQDLTATAFETGWQEGVVLEPDEREAGEATTKGEALDFAVDLSGYHVERVAPAVHPIAVEQAVTVTLPDSDVLVTGYIDLIDLTPAGDVIRDLKSSEKAPNGNAAETSLQLTIYASLWKADVGTLPSSLVLDYLTRSPAKRLKNYVPLTTTRDDEDLAVLGRRIQTAVSLVEKGIFMPAPADSWMCSPTWCSYFPTCPFVRRGARRPVT